MRTAVRGLVVSSLILSAAASPRTNAAANDLAGQVRTLLQKHCQRCHGPDSPGKGGMNYILERDRLVARGKLVPGNAAGSLLLQRVTDGEMPPQSVKTRPTPKEIALLRHWIEAGAPAVQPAGARRERISEAEVIRRIVADLKALSPRQRRFARYFSLAPPYNAGLADQELEHARQALAKLVNSLSWHPRLTLPRSIDSARTIYRIDLRDLQWSAALWNRLLEEYPYRLPRPTAEFRAIAAATGTELPYVRADWFVATASRAPLYYDLLRLPVFDRELERQLRVDVLQDIQDDRAARAGFNGSGVSRNNRLIERHDAAFGAYWRSYDFAANTDRQNLFDHPLGPVPGQNSFQHSGGEIIFHLPNGLQGYLLVDAAGRRIDRAPIEIVSDPKRPDRAVEAGLSCMSCHAQGVIFKADQVRAHVAKNPTAFTKEDAAAVRALYLPEARFKALVAEDAGRFRKALQKTGLPLTGPEPIAALTLRYEGEMDLETAAAELDLLPDDFLRRLGRSISFSRALGPLKIKGGVVQRQVFLALFPDLVREFGLPEETKTASARATGLEPLALPRPFAGHTGHVLCLAFSPDGKQALSGGEDNQVRLWDVAGGKELQLLRGHTAEVQAVVFAPDGKHALSAGSDRTIRWWNLADGRELRRLEGHTDRVGSIAVSPDGKRALSGSWDRTVSLWDLEGGKELRRLESHAGPVSAVAFSPDGKRALTGSHDRTVRLWDLDSGRLLRSLAGSDKEIFCVAFSPNGKFALSGGNDNLVRLWSLESGTEVRRFEGHGSAVVQVAFTPDGKRILSGSSQYRGTSKCLRLWDRQTGRLLHAFGSGSETVWSIAFAPDGKRALSGTSEKTIRLWDLSH